jgi:hypothetical protein
MKKYIASLAVIAAASSKCNGEIAEREESSFKKQLILLQT